MKALKTTLLLAFILLLAEVRAQTNETEEDNTIYTILEKSPSFPGGLDSLKSYLKTNAKYPEIYRRYQYKEMLIVNFVIEKDGYISNIKLLQGGFKEFEKTAIEISREYAPLEPSISGRGTEKVLLYNTDQILPRRLHGMVKSHNNLSIK